MTLLSNIFPGGIGQRAKLLHIEDRKTAGTNGGNFASGAWQTRDLNTVVANEVANASLSSNQITLPAGEYFIVARSTAVGVNRHKLRLYDVTNTAVLMEGLNEEVTTSVSGIDPALLSGKFILSTSTTIRLEHRCETTNANGFGFQMNSAFSVTHETYSQVYIWKIEGQSDLPVNADLLHVEDQKSSGSAGGTFTSGAWQTRTLNTVVTNLISGASLSSNQVTLPAGRYYFEAHAPAFQVNVHKTQLYNISDTVSIKIGTTEDSSAADAVTTRSFVSGEFTLTASKTIELQHRCTNTVSSNGFGAALSTSGVEVYAALKIWKLS